MTAIAAFGKVLAAEEGWAADIRRTRHIGDFTKWKAPDVYQKAFDRLLRDFEGRRVHCLSVPSWIRAIGFQRQTMQFQASRTWPSPIAVFACRHA